MQDENKNELELLMKDNEQLELLGQGTYGCAFYPEISCKTHHIQRTSRQFLSKIQYEDESLKRELKVGERIVKTIPNYRLFFAPIIESCPVELSELRQNKIKQCSVLNPSTSRKKRIVSSKIPYLGKFTLDKYFNSLFEKKYCELRNNNNNIKTTTTTNLQCRNMSVTYLKKLVQTYLYLIQSFSKLNTQVGIVHLDVKGDNIMYSSTADVPVLIDFGLSFCVDWLTLPNYYKFPYPFGIESFSYSPWSIEVSILTHLARYIRRKTEAHKPNRHGGYLDEELFKTQVTSDLIRTYQSFCEEYVVNNIRSQLVYTDTERRKLISDLQTWIETLSRGKTLEQLWTGLLSTHDTWDLYAVGVMYLYEMEDSGFLRLYAQQQEQHQKQEHPVMRFKQQLKNVVLSVPSQRPKAQKMFQEGRALFSTMTVAHYEHVANNNLPFGKGVVQQQRAERAVILSQGPEKE